MKTPEEWADEMLRAWWEVLRRTTQGPMPPVPFDPEFRTCAGHSIRAAVAEARREERGAFQPLLDAVDVLLGDGLGRDPDFVDGAKVNAVENELAAIRSRSTTPDAKEGGDRANS